MPEEVDSLASRVIRQHSRFQNESRLSARLSGYFGVLENEEFNVIAQLISDTTGEVACTALYQLNALLPAGNISGESADSTAHALPRGIAEDLPFSDLSISQALDRGFRQIGRGIIQSEECCGSGRLMLHNYMGRISDSMPHLWHVFEELAEPNVDEGGAILEFRKRIFIPLQKSDVYMLLSGVIDVAPKIQQFGHLMFNVQTQQCIMSAHAVAVRMDLIARRAKTLSLEDQKSLAGLRIRAIT
jgi:acyl-CoA thioester hydrolase